MADNTFEFSFSMKGIDRRAYLLEAADRFDHQHDVLGSKNQPLVTSSSPEGMLARDLLDDVARIADAPIIYPITDQVFINHEIGIPFRFKELGTLYNFYWLEIPIILFPKHNWAFHRLEIGVSFNPNSPHDGTRPKAYRILPDKQFQSLLKTSTHIEVRLDENFELSARAGSSTLPVDIIQNKLEANANAKFASNVSFIADPFVYSIKRAKIDHSAIGAEEVFWRLDGTEFFQENTPRLVVITQVPKRVQKFEIAVAMQAYRRFNTTTVGLRDAVMQLPRVLKQFFTEGVPLLAETTWNVSSML